MNLAIFLPNWLGDLAMATPALRALRRHFGSQTRIVGILRPKLAGLLDGTHWIDEEWHFDPRGKMPGERRWALIRRMRRERFDMAVLLTNSFDTALLAWLGGTRERIGYVRNGRGWLLTGKLYPRRVAGQILPGPMVDYYLALAEALGCRPVTQPPSAVQNVPTRPGAAALRNDSRPGAAAPHDSWRRLELAVTDAEEQLGRRIWENLHLRPDGRVIALNCGGAYGSAKRWPPEHCGELARRIADELDHDALVLCGPGEEVSAREIVALARHPRGFSLADQPLGLAATKACLKRCRMLVSTDSGPRHVGAALGLPVVTLLGPTAPIWIENPTVRGAFVALKLDCSGCGKRVCPLGHHRCMKELTPEIVFRAVLDVLHVA